MLFEAFKRNRKEHPDLAAFLVASGDRSLSISWKQFTDDIAVVEWIIEHYAHGGKIALLGENSYEWIVAHAACLFSDAVVVPVEPALSAEDIARRLKSVGATVLIHSMLYSEKVYEISARMPGLATGRFASRKTDVFIHAAVKALPHVKDGLWSRECIDTQRTSMLLFTSGTTSEPRAVELTVRSIEAFAESAGNALGFMQGERSLMLLPMHHVYGLASVYAMLINGVSLGVCPDFRRVLAAFSRFEADYAFLVPAIADILAVKMSRIAESAEVALGKPVKWIVTGGAPVSRRTYERMTSLGIRMLGAYGLTETAACYSISDIREGTRACSAGKVSSAAGVETAVLPSGELIVRGPNVMRGYYRMPDRTAEVIDGDGWFHTGDIGRIDEDGYVWITGRISRTIVLSSGKKVAPEELEDKIVSLPGVIEALVTGDGENRVISAEVYAAVSEESVRRAIAALNATLPVFQRINRIQVRRDPFPRTASGKIFLR